MQHNIFSLQCTFHLQKNQRLLIVTSLLDFRFKENHQKKSVIEATACFVSNFIEANKISFSAAEAENRAGSVSQVTAAG